MIFVIDSNVLISALIKDSITRSIIIDSGMDFYYPEASFHEVRKYKNLVLEKSGVEDKKYDDLLNRLLKYITLVPKEKIMEKLEDADKIMGAIDKNDVLFIATALAYSATIWSDDKDFKKQNKVKILTTTDLVKIQNINGNGDVR